MRGNQEYPVEKIVGEPLQIIDGRKKGSKWQLYAKLQQPLTNSSGKILSNGLSYQVDKEKKTLQQMLIKLFTVILQQKIENKPIFLIIGMILKVFF